MPQYANWLLAFGLMSVPAAAKVTEALPAGFTGEHQMTIAAPPERVWQALIDIDRWWSKSHSYGGEAARFTLDPRAGGCWCEVMPNGGSVEHQRILQVQPGKLLRMSGALGPMHAFAVTGVTTFELKPDGAGTALTVTSRVGGVFPGGLDKIAAPVDGVLALQLARLKVVAEAK